MSIFREQLTQMQMDLEAGLEEVSEAVANRGGGEAERNIPIFHCPNNIGHSINTLEWHTM